MVVRRFIGKVVDHYVLAVKGMVSSRGFDTLFAP